MLPITEQENPNTINIDQVSTLESISLIFGLCGGFDGVAKLSKKWKINFPYFLQPVTA